MIPVPPGRQLLPPLLVPLAACGIPQQDGIKVDRHLGMRTGNRGRREHSRRHEMRKKIAIRRKESLKALGVF